MGCLRRRAPGACRRGQLIALSLGRKSRAERLLRDKHRARLASPRFWSLLDSGVLAAEWAFGHLRTATLSFGTRRPSTRPASTPCSLRRCRALALRERVGARASGLTAAACIGLCGEGVFRGRFERLKTWDVVTDPRNVVQTCLSVLLTR